jgi:hypothetical protein
MKVLIREKEAKVERQINIETKTERGNEAM